MKFVYLMPNSLIIAINFNRVSTFWRRTSYSFSSRRIFRSSACRPVLRVVSSFSFAFSFLAEGSLASPAFLISLAAASYKMISLSKPRRNFSLSFDACIGYRRASACGRCRSAFPEGQGRRSVVPYPAGFPWYGWRRRQQHRTVPPIPHSCQCRVQ